MGDFAASVSDVLLGFCSIGRKESATTPSGNDNGQRSYEINQRRQKRKENNQKNILFSNENNLKGPLPEDLIDATTTLQ